LTYWQKDFLQLLLEFYVDLSERRYISCFAVHSAEGGAGMILTQEVFDYFQRPTEPMQAEVLDLVEFLLPESLVERHFPPWRWLTKSGRKSAMVNTNILSMPSIRVSLDAFQTGTFRNHFCLRAELLKITHVISNVLAA
jgi:hypothetical protein